MRPYTSLNQIIIMMMIYKDDDVTITTQNSNVDSNGNSGIGSDGSLKGPSSYPSPGTGTFNNLPMHVHVQQYRFGLLATQSSVRRTFQSHVLFLQDARDDVSHGA